jgi:hypothetical protein
MARVPINLHQKVDKKEKNADDKQEQLEKLKFKAEAEAASFSWVDIVEVIRHIQGSHIPISYQLNFFNLFYLRYTQLLEIKQGTLFASLPMRFSRLSKMKI